MLIRAPYALIVTVYFAGTLVHGQESDETTLPPVVVRPDEAPETPPEPAAVQPQQPTFFDPPLD